MRVIRCALATAALLAAAFAGTAQAADPACSAAVAAPGATSQPAFKTPPGGRLQDLTAQRTSLLDEAPLRTCRAVRADGTKAAEMTLDSRGRPLEQTTFDVKGKPVETVFAYYDSRDAKRAERRQTGFRGLKEAYCATYAVNPSGYTWQGVNPFPIWWYINFNSFPDSWNFNDLTAHLQAAINVWNTNNNWCGQPDQSAVTTSYRGATTAGKSTGDLRNVVMMAPTLACTGPGAVACTTRGYGCATCIVDSDTVFKAGEGWGFVGNPLKLDVWVTMTHEWGHALGWSHVPGSLATMGEGANARGDLSDRALQGGEAQSNNILY